MPTYYARGVTATLATCDLESSLSYNTSFRQGAEQKRDSARMRDVFAAADKLCERPIGEDGSDRGVLQFIGVDGDMPLYVVEARPEFLHDDEIIEDFQMQDAPAASPVDSANEKRISSDGSPLTSLGETPSPVTPGFFMNSPSKNHTHARLTVDAVAALEDSFNVNDKIEAARSTNKSSTARALVLDVQVSENSFLHDCIPNGRGTQTSTKNLKLEVFINGELADVAIIHGAEGRRKNKPNSGEQVWFSGTRIHRQLEKPWIYSKGVTKLNNMSNVGNKKCRWNAVSAAYAKEAASRGRNRIGDPPPSADFLLALAGMKLPRRVKEQPHLGIVDLVITVGKGSKYGPDTSYLTKPTKMDDPNYPNDKTVEEQHTNSNQNHTSVAPSSISPSPGQNIDLVKELNLDVDPNKLLVGIYENSRGAKGKSGRTLQQRLGDLKKMNSANLERELAKLKDEFGAKEPSPKKQRLDSTTAQTEVFLSPPKPSIETTIEPTKLLMKFPSTTENGTDPDAILTQSRIDAASQHGAASSGPLLRRIASTSPQRTPKRITKASALASSPTSTPVKTPQRAPRTPRGGVESGLGGGRTETQQALAVGQAGASASATPNSKSTATTPRAKPAEQQVAEALDGFEIPQNCRGSCVSYKEDVEVSRQIGKVRGGEFKEEALLVGMRFVVL